jgi:hypothetical protein
VLGKYRKLISKAGRPWLAIYMIREMSGIFITKDINPFGIGFII